MGGDALMGIGEASGEGRATSAAEQAISSQLLEDTSIRGARAVLLHVAGNSSLSFHEAHACLGVVQEGAGGQADVYMGVGMDESLGDAVRVTVIATGFGVEPEAAPAPEGNDELSRFRWRKREFDFDVDFSSGMAPSRNQATTGSGYGTDSEIPAFLRRQAD
jgi:cell division protein FtsZ